MEASLRNVALTLAGLSVGIWLLAALVGRRLCNHGPAPRDPDGQGGLRMTAARSGPSLAQPGDRRRAGRLASSFNGLLDRLHQEFERQKRFTGDASHQLRTPLTALLGQLEVARRRDRTSRNTSAFWTTSTARPSSSGRSSRPLLFMARAETEAGRPDLQPLELVTWVRRPPERVVRPRASRRSSQEIQLDAPAWVQGPLAPAGPVARQPAGQRLQVQRAGHADRRPALARRRTVVLAVQDRGFGLMAEDLPHVFEPFFRSAERPPRGHPGVGLGLAVVQRIAAVFGGTISALSVPGQGSQFVVRLPEATESIPASGSAEPPAAMGLAREKFVFQMTDSKTVQNRRSC